MSIHTVGLWEKKLPKLNEAVLEMAENETRATKQAVEELGEEVRELIKENKDEMEERKRERQKKEEEKHVTNDVTSPDQSESIRRKLLSYSENGRAVAHSKRSFVVEDETDNFAAKNDMDDDEIEDDWLVSDKNSIKVEEESQPDSGNEY
jgi:hypothetical protein